MLQTEIDECSLDALEAFLSENLRPKRHNARFFRDVHRTSGTGVRRAQAELLERDGLESPHVHPSNVLIANLTAYTQQIDGTHQ